MNSPFIGIESDVDLRKVNWRDDVLQRLAKRYKVGNGKSFLFVNKAITRMRYIQNTNGIVELVMCPMAKKNKRNNKVMMRVCDSHLSNVSDVEDNRVLIALEEIRVLAENRIAVARNRKMR